MRTRHAEPLHDRANKSIKFIGNRSCAKRSLT